MWSPRERGMRVVNMRARTQTHTHSIKFDLEAALQRAALLQVGGGGGGCYDNYYDRESLCYGLF